MAEEKKPEADKNAPKKAAAPRSVELMYLLSQLHKRQSNLYNL